MMRKWMRERAKRRKGTENTSESTVKIGQTIDHSKPAPLVPSYDSGSTHSQRAETEEEGVESKPVRRPRREREQERQRESDNRMEVETQPESPTAPSESGDVMRRPPPSKKEPRGVVVLTIGLPGS